MSDKVGRVEFGPAADNQRKAKMVADLAKNAIVNIHHVCPAPDKEAIERQAIHAERNRMRKAVGLCEFGSPGQDETDRDLREAIVREWAKGQETAGWRCEATGVQIEARHVASHKETCGGTLVRLIAAPAEKGGRDGD